MSALLLACSSNMQILLSPDPVQHEAIIQIPAPGILLYFLNVRPTLVESEVAGQEPLECGTSHLKQLLPRKTSQQSRLCGCDSLKGWSEAPTKDRHLCFCMPTPA